MNQRPPPFASAPIPRGFVRAFRTPAEFEPLEHIAFGAGYLVRECPQIFAQILRAVVDRARPVAFVNSEDEECLCQMLLAATLKPAFRTPLSSLFLARILIGAGLPEGAFACLTGRGNKIGAALCSDRATKLIACAGSRKTVLTLRKSSGLTPIAATWCGPSIVIATDDIDVATTADDIVAKSFKYAGQVGFAPHWILAHRDVHDALAHALGKRISALRTGDPSHGETEVGPLISIEAAREIERLLREEKALGADCAVGGARDGNLFAPTLLTNIPLDSPHFGHREILGPILGISRFSNFDEVIRALDSRAIVMSALLCRDLDRSIRLSSQIGTANNHINGIPRWADGLIYHAGSKTRMGRRTARDRIHDMMTVVDIVRHPTAKPF